MAIGLRKNLTPDVPALHQAGWKTEARELFTQSLLTPSREGHAFFIALCIYGGFYALHKHAFLVASILLALSTFLLAWKSTFSSEWPPGKEGSHSRPALRLAREGLTAVLLTAAVLLLGFQRGIYSNAMSAASAPDRSSVSRYLQEKSRPGDSALSGYESIILWPVPEKKKLLAPTSSGTSSQAVRMTKPLVIRLMDLTGISGRPAKDLGRGRTWCMGLRWELISAPPISFHCSWKHVRALALPSRYVLSRN